MPRMKPRYLRGKYRRPSVGRKAPRGYPAHKKLQYVFNAVRYVGWFFEDRWVEYATAYFSENERKRLCNDIIDTAKRLRLDIESDENSLKNGYTSTIETIVNLYRNAMLKKRLTEMLLARLEMQFSKQNPGEDASSKKIKQIADIFALSTIEKQVLEILYLHQMDSSLERLYDDLCERAGFKTGNYLGVSVSKKKPISVLTGLRSSNVARALSDSSNLLKSGILDKDRDLAVEVVQYIEGSSTKAIGKNYFSQYCGKPVPLSSHTIDYHNVETIKTLLAHRGADQPINILLYGVPGTGKTEFARSLGRHLNFPTYEISGMNNEGGDSDSVKNTAGFRYRALLACQRTVDTARSMIIVDEADSMLNTVAQFFFASPSTEKGTVNRILDESKAFTVWITNQYDCIDDSTKRRFDYSIGFEKLTFEQRYSIWQNAIRKHRIVRFFSQENIEQLATAYEISAGGIDIALRNVVRMVKKTGKRDSVMPLIDNLLKAHLKILDQDTDKTRAKAPNGPVYDIDAINVKGDIRSTLQLLDAFNAYWGSAKEQSIYNMNLLLYGPPGTGKTEFAKYVARRFKRRLIVKRASDLLDMYVGNSEKFIKQAFREAEKDMAVLFIDEADTFLGSRESAHQSWEISQVNEFLTNMETFKGMLICSTNFRKIFDSAAIRRFNIKLEFDYLQPGGILKLYQVFMSRIIDRPLSRSESAELRGVRNLTAGDFKVVYQRHYFLDKSALTHKMLIDSLVEEVRAKGSNAGKIMGFSR